MEFKDYKCKICKNIFHARNVIRNHLSEDHFIKKDKGEKIN